MQSTSVNTRIGTYLDIIAQAHRAQLLNFFPSPFIGCEAKAVGPQHHACMQNAAFTHHAVLSHRHTRLQHGIRSNAGATLYHAQGADKRCGMYHRQRIHHCRGVNAYTARPIAVAPPQLGEFGKVQIGLISDNARPTLQGRLLHQGPNDDAARFGSQ